MSGTMEHYPVLPTEATHVVSVNSRLALRDAPAYLASSNLASEDNHIKGEIIDMMPNGTRLIVIDEGVGYECEWAQVLVEGATYPQGSKMWTSTKYIVKLSGTAESAPMECSEKAWGNPRAVPLLDWASKPPMEVFFDEHDARYKVCVEMSEEEYTSTGGAEIMTRLREATVHGLRYILRYNGKNSEDDYISGLMDSNDSTWLQFVRATEYHVDTKPNSYLKVLVELPHRYVPPLEDAKGVVETSAGRSLVAWDATEKVRIRSTYNTLEFKDCCNKLALLLEEYAVDIDGYEGTVNDFDPREEAARIRQVAGVLDVLFRANDITHDTWSKREVLEIGWDATLTPVFVALTLSDGRVIAMSGGMEEYADTPPIDSQRTQGYIWQLNLLCKAKYSDRPWVEWVKAFTLPDAPSIIPGKPGEDSPGDITDVDDPASAEAKKTDALPIKTYAEKLTEDRRLGTPAFKSKLYEARKDAFEFVGSGVASCEGLQKTLDKINTIDDAFGEVLDKISIADLIKQCMSAIAPELSSLSDAADNLGTGGSLGGVGSLGDIDVGSGIGIGDVPDVGLDYDWSNPSVPGMGTNLQLANMGSMSVESFGLGGINFGDLGLGSMSAADLGLGDYTIGDLGIGSLGVCTAGFGSKTLGELGVNLDTLGIADRNFSEIDFGDLTVGDLDLDLSSLSIADVGWSDVRLSNVGVEIEDLGLTTLDVQNMGYDLETMDTSHLTFAELGKEDANIGEHGLNFDDVSMGNIDLSSKKIGDLDANLDAVKVEGCGCDTTVDQLGLDSFSLSSLNLDSFSIDSLGIGGISLGEMGLGNLDMDALGLSGADLAGLKGKFEELGLDGVVGQLEDMGLGSLGVDVGSLENLSTEFTKEFDSAMDKLDGMIGDIGAGENPFEQGTPKLIVDLAITLADNLPTEDIMGSMAEMIEDALTMFLQELFVAMVKAVLEQMLENCGENPTQAGKENLNDMLGSSPNNTGQADPLAGLMAALGTGLSGAGAAAARSNPNSEAARAAVTPELRREMADMLDDVSLMFTPMELCSLINGKASAKVVLLARNFIAKRYPDMGLSTRTKTADFFKAFGGLIDPSICRIIETPLTTSQGPILGEVLCSSGDMRDLRKEMLRNKGDDITDDQIDAILDKLKQRKVNAAKVLADIVNNGPLSDDYEPPPITCQKNATPKNASTPNNASANNVPGMDKQGGLVNLEHESIDFAIDTASENLFVPLEVAYSREMKMYPKAFTADSEDEEESTIPVWMDEDKKILNPTLQAQYGTPEVAEKALEDKGYTSGEVVVKSKVRKAVPPLYSALKEMETSDSLVFKDYEADSVLFQPTNIDGIADDFPFEGGGHGIELVLPTMAANDVAAISSILESEAADEMDGKTKELIQKTITDLSNAEPTWRLYYILPKLTAGGVHEGTNINVFLIVVTETKTIAEETSETVVYRAVSTKSPDDNILALLEGETGDLYDLFENLFASYGGGPVEAPYSAPQWKFGSLAYNRFIDAGASPNVAHEGFTAVAETGGYFDAISRDIFAFISRKIAAGPYFKNVTSSSGASGKTGISSSTPVVEFLELDPEPTAQQQVDGISPHPLGLQQKKKCMKENIKNNQCVDFNRPTDGSPASELSDTEKELMTVAVESIVQTYMADHYLRGLFANSVFKMPDTPDEAYINHVTGFILSDMASYDVPSYVTLPSGERKATRPHGTYQDDFIAECVRMYEKPSDLDTDEETPGGEVSEWMAVGQQIEKAYPTVVTQMESLVGAQNTDDLEKLFLTEYLPEIPISDFGKMDNKFFGGTNISLGVGLTVSPLMLLIGRLSSTEGKAASGGTYAGATSTSDEVTINSDNAADIEAAIKYLTEQPFTNSLSEWSETASGVDYSNGNLYIEHYYLIEDHDEEPAQWAANFHLSDIWKARGYTWTPDSPVESYKYYGVVSLDDYKELKEALPPNTTMSGGGTFSMSGVRQEPAVKSVKRGMRIMYLPPTDKSKMIGFSLSQTDASMDLDQGVFGDVEVTPEEIFKAAWSASADFQTGEKFNYIANVGNTGAAEGFGTVTTGISLEQAVKSKAYKILEIIHEATNISFGTAEETTGALQGHESDVTTSTFSGTGRSNAYLVKETNPIPILDYNYDIGATAQFSAAVDATVPDDTAGYEDIETQLLNSDEWKTLSQYIFPISRMQSILAHFCFQSASTKQEIATAMTDSKDKCYTIFNAINSKGDYKQKDPALEAVGGIPGLEKMMLNEFGLLDMPAGENSWNYNLPVGWGKPVKGLGLELFAKATAEALQKMFKRWAEKHDPNISLAHKLSMVCKMAGTNINTLAWSFMILPANVFPFAPIGPILGPVSIIYHALGLGLFKRVKDDESDAATEINNQLAELGMTDSVALMPPQTCDDSQDGTTAWEAQQGKIIVRELSEYFQDAQSLAASSVASQAAAIASAASSGKMEFYEAEQVGGDAKIVANWRGEEKQQATATILEGDAYSTSDDD